MHFRTKLPAIFKIGHDVDAEEAPEQIQLGGVSPRRDHNTSTARTTEINRVFSSFKIACRRRFGFRKNSKSGRASAPASTSQREHEAPRGQTNRPHTATYTGRPGALAACGEPVVMGSAASIQSTRELQTSCVAPPLPEQACVRRVNIHRPVIVAGDGVHHAQIPTIHDGFNNPSEEDPLSGSFFYIYDPIADAFEVLRAVGDGHSASTDSTLGCRKRSRSSVGITRESKDSPDGFGLCIKRQPSFKLFMGVDERDDSVSFVPNVSPNTTTRSSSSETANPESSMTDFSGASTEPSMPRTTAVDTPCLIPLQDGLVGFGDISHLQLESDLRNNSECLEDVPLGIGVARLDAEPGALPNTLWESSLGSDCSTATSRNDHDGRTISAASLAVDLASHPSITIRRSGKMLRARPATVVAGRRRTSRRVR